jgi:hypothetical protein
MAWESWRKWVGYGVEYGGKLLPGVFSKATDAIGEDLIEAERKRKEAEAAAKKDAAAE